MNIVRGSTPVADYCNALARGEIRVNRQYQRSEKVWPDAARSYLIETILLGYPLPKFYLHQITDLRSRQTVKEIVDGQQRSMAILDYFQNGFRLSRTIETEEAAGRRYDELPEELQRAFVEYGLEHDLFVGATAEEVRTVFQRMNSYTFPLNPEEQRHASFQGPFKWFINGLSREYSEALHSIGSFTEKQLIRMQDTKLLTEVAHALLSGITTTRPTMLRALYKSRDRDFPEEENLRHRIGYSLDHVIAWDAIHQTDLMKPYVLYALVLAITHVHEPVDELQDQYQSPGLDDFNLDRVIENLLVLADALENPDANEDYREFIEASSGRTNVASQRSIRFRWFCEALTENM